MAALLLHLVGPKLNFVCLVLSCSVKLIEQIAVITPPIHMEAPKWWQASKREYIIQLGSEVGRSQSINFSNNLALSLPKKGNCFNWQNTEQPLNWMKLTGNRKLDPSPSIFHTLHLM